VRRNESRGATLPVRAQPDNGNRCEGSLWRAVCRSGLDEDGCHFIRRHTGETLADKGDITTLATHYTSDAIRFTRAGAFQGQDAMAEDLTEINKIFKNITIKTNKMEGTDKGTIFCGGE
jgi:hypothetical protein